MREGRPVTAMCEPVSRERGATLPWVLLVALAWAFLALVLR